MIRRVKGTQDLLNMRLYDAIIDVIKHHFLNAHFSHIQTPIMEYVELFQHSVGEHTDIVNKEMYTFSANKKETLCLRPEGTAATMRAYLENKITQRPWKVFSHGPMFRHERPQKGRYRQFHQFNLEVINRTSIVQDAHMIVLLDSLFKHALQIKDYVLSINYLGTRDDRNAHKTALAAFLDAHEQALCATCKTRKESNMLRVFDCKNQSCQNLYTDAPLITDYLQESSEKEWQTFQTMLRALGVSFVHNPRLVRGLDYYNNSVFEFSSSHLGTQSAFCGGGQYDLSQQLGKKDPLHSVGAAIGMERLLMILEAGGLSDDDVDDLPLCAVIPFSEEQNLLALLLSEKIHAHGFHVDIFPGGIKKALKKADKDNVAYALLLGEDEVSSHTVTIKDMETGESDMVKQSDVISWLSDRI